MYQKLFNCHLFVISILRFIAKKDKSRNTGKSYVFRGDCHLTNKSFGKKKKVSIANKTGIKISENHLLTPIRKKDLR